MLGELSKKESIDFLKNYSYGRIGCYAFGKVYVVPLSYAYKSDALYFHTFDGQKVEMMRKNPDVCFQVDQLDGMANWKSVIIHGKFEELSKEERNKGIDILLKRKIPAVVSETVKLAPDWPFTDLQQTKIPGIVFRIGIKDITGRFENTISQPK